MYSKDYLRLLHKAIVYVYLVLAHIYNYFNMLIFVRIVITFDISIVNNGSGSYRSRHVAQLVSALPSVLEVPGSILSNVNVCFDFPLICVALVLNTRKMERIKGALSASINFNYIN